MSHFRLITGKIEKATRESAAFDLFYSGPDEFVLHPGSPRVVPTGVTTEFSADLVAIIKEKSGLALKGLEVHGGVIDADYRKEWGVIAAYNSPFPQPLFIKPGQAIAQFLLVRLPEVNLWADVTASLILRDTTRVGGFGSTEKQ